MKFIKHNRIILISTIACITLFSGLFVYTHSTNKQFFLESSAFALSKKSHPALPDVSSLPIEENNADGIFFPQKKQSGVNIEIFKHLKYNHYKKVPVDDQLSTKIFERYLDDLDSTRSYFLSDDIKEFQIYRYNLDDALKKGELEPAYSIFNRFQTRVIDRQEFMIKMINMGLENIDFSIEETIDIDRKDVPWSTNKTVLDELWRKRLKNEVLNLKFAGKSLSNIQELLLKRYTSQLNRVKQRNSEDVFRTYMNSFTQIYDPHTQYFSPRVSENFNIQMKLSLEGIGAVLQSKNEYTKIVRLISAGPADKSGLLKPGDRIVGVGQGADSHVVDVIGWRLDDVVELIRGPKKTIVNLEIIPVDAVDEQATKLVNITRNTVKLEEQAAQKKVLKLNYGEHAYKIGIIDLPTFYIDFTAYQKGQKDYRSTTRDVRVLVEQLIAEKVDGIIVDLRDNGGGALQEANSLTGLFIKEGPVVQVRGARGYTKALKDTDPEIIYEGPLLVLINRMSASASEIFAGAIQDYNRGIIVGSQSFGKGTVQTLERLKQGQLKMTQGKFYRISGKSTQHKGIIPDILYPTIYDKEKIGESALSEALEWDKIDPVTYQAYASLSDTIHRLKERHDARIKNDPGFDYLIEGINHLKKARKKNKISLNEKTRKKEREESELVRLELENKKRAFNGLEPLKSVSDLTPDDDSEEEVESEEDSNDTFDPILTETQKILLDYILLSTERYARTQ